MHETEAQIVPQLMRPKEAAKYLGISANTLLSMLKRGEIDCFRPDGYRMWLRKIDLDQWIDRLKMQRYEVVPPRNEKLLKENRQKKRKATELAEAQ